MTRNSDDAQQDTQEIYLTLANSFGGIAKSMQDYGQGNNSIYVLFKQIEKLALEGDYQKKIELPSELSETHKLLENYTKLELGLTRLKQKIITSLKLQVVLLSNVANDYTLPVRLITDLENALQQKPKNPVLQLPMYSRISIEYELDDPPDKLETELLRPIILYQQSFHPDIFATISRCEATLKQLQSTQQSEEMLAALKKYTSILTLMLAVHSADVHFAQESEKANEARQEYNISRRTRSTQQIATRIAYATNRQWLATSLAEINAKNSKLKALKDHQKQTLDWFNSLLNEGQDQTLHNTNLRTNQGQSDQVLTGQGPIRQTKKRKRPNHQQPSQQDASEENTGAFLAPYPYQIQNQIITDPSARTPGGFFSTGAMTNIQNPFSTQEEQSLQQSPNLFAANPYQAPAQETGFNAMPTGNFQNPPGQQFFQESTNAMQNPQAPNKQQVYSPPYPDFSGSNSYQQPPAPNPNTQQSNLLAEPQQGKDGGYGGRQI